MSETIAVENPVEHDFPATSPGLVKRIPKPVLVSGGILIALLLIVVTFPRKTKSKAISENMVPESSTVDSYEQQSPIKTDPFATESMELPGNNDNPLSRSASIVNGTDFRAPDMQPPSLSSSTPSSPSVGGTHSTAPSLLSSGSPNDVFKPSASIESRLSDSYQAMVGHFKKSKQVVAIDGDAYDKLLDGDKLDRIEQPLKNLTENSARYANKVNFSVPSGTRIRAVTQQEVNSDHPGYFTARITSPSELNGYKLLCQSRGNTRDRIPVTANKIIAPDGSRETQIPGEVQMKYAGLEGDIKSHALKRLVPPIASAFVGAGAGYLYFKALGGDELNSEAGRINTADAVVSGPYQEGVSGVQREITRMGGDYPNTVVVPQGVQFELLVTEPFSIEL